MIWLQRGVSDGSLAFNTSDALVHFIRFKGAPALLLVSPLIFRRYIALGNESDEKLSSEADPAQRIQTHFCAAKWNEREFIVDPITGASHKGKNIMFFKVKVGRTPDKSKALKGILLCNPDRFFNPPFVLNPFIAHVSEDFGSEAIAQIKASP